MAGPEVLEARSAEALGPILEVLKDQSFLYANLHHDVKERTLALAVERKFPPRKGNWVLEFRGVGGKRIHHPGNNQSDTVRSIDYDAEKGEVVILCVLDEIRITVDSLDARATLHDGKAGERKFTREDLPEKYQKEFREKEDEEESARMRVVERKRMLYHKGAATAAAFSLFIGLYQCVLSEGRPVVDLLLLPATGWATMYYCLRTGRDQLWGSLIYGLPAFLMLALAMTVVHQGSLMIVFCGALMHIALGQVFVMWIRNEELNLT